VVRDGNWKLIEWFEEGRDLELYNLKTDIGEQNNLAATNPGKTQQLHALLQKWRQEVGAKMPTKNPTAQAAGKFVEFKLGFRFFEVAVY